jgi:hypothetical protein
MKALTFEMPNVVYAIPAAKSIWLKIGHEVIVEKRLRFFAKAILGIGYAAPNGIINLVSN